MIKIPGSINNEDSPEGNESGVVIGAIGDASKPRPICNVCQKNPSKYTCPRCNAQYCSLSCYKAHSTQCTESFHTDNLMQYLKEERASEEMKRKTMEMLARLHEQQLQQQAAQEEEEGAGGASHDEILAEIMEKLGIDIDAAESGEIGDIDIEKLKTVSRTLWNDFQKALHDGRLASAIQQWTPWWLSPPPPSSAPSPEPTTTTTTTTTTTQNQNNSNNTKKKILIEEIPSPTIATTTAAAAHSSKTSSTQKPMSSIQQSSISAESEVDLSFLDNLPPLSSLTKKQPSDNIMYNLVDILYAYCFVQRLFNGEIFSDTDSILEAVETVCLISSILTVVTNKPPTSTRTRTRTAAGESMMITTTAATTAAAAAATEFTSVGAAVDSVLSKSKHPSVYNGSLAFPISVLNDVGAILSGAGTGSKRHILRALAEIQHLFDRAASSLAQTTTMTTPPAAADKAATASRKKALRLLERKVYFYIVWANEASDFLFHNLALIVAHEHKELQLYHQQQQQQQQL